MHILHTIKSNLICMWQILLHKKICKILHVNSSSWKITQILLTNIKMAGCNISIIFRLALRPNYTAGNVGFRCAKSVPIVKPTEKVQPPTTPRPPKHHRYEDTWAYKVQQVVKDVFDNIKDSAKLGDELWKNKIITRLTFKYKICFPNASMSVIKSYFKTYYPINPHHPPIFDKHS